VLPEGEDIRTIKASDYINREKLADLILLGNKDRIDAICKSMDWI